MLARVLLHKVEPARPVQRNSNLAADRQRVIHVMVDFAMLLAHVQNDGFSNGSGVGRLTAALRKENGLVEHDVEPLFGGGTGGYDGGVRTKMAVQVIKAFRHNNSPVTDRKEKEIFLSND